MLDNYTKLKKHNRDLACSVYDADLKYIKRVIPYVCANGIGMLEGEIIKKDLLGMALEAEQLGESLENRLGDVTEFAQGLIADTGGTDRKTRRLERLYNGMWQVGFMLSLMSALLIVIAGMHKEPVSFALLSIYTVIAVVYYLLHTYIFDRFSLHNNWYEEVLEFGLFIALYTAIDYIMTAAGAWGPKLPGYTMFILLAIGIALYVAGRTLFEKQAVKTAEDNHWDITSLG